MTGRRCITFDIDTHFPVVVEQILHLGFHLTLPYRLHTSASREIYPASGTFSAFILAEIILTIPDIPAQSNLVYALCLSAHSKIPSFSVQSRVYTLHAHPKIPSFSSHVYGAPSLCNFFLHSNLRPVSACTIQANFLGRSGNGKLTLHLYVDQIVHVD